MALPNSGIMTAAMINQELKRAENAPFSLDDPEVRKLAGKLSGAISFQDFYGKSSETVVTLSTSSNVIIKDHFPDWGEDTEKRLIITGAVSDTAKSNFALTLIPRGAPQSDSYGGSLTIEIKHFINGTGGTPGTASAQPGVGGTAILIGQKGKNGQLTKIINTSTIRAGGGGGGMGGAGGGGQVSSSSREPTTGEAYNNATVRTYWDFAFLGNKTWEVWWNGTQVAKGIGDPPTQTNGNDGWVYYRGNDRDVYEEQGWVLFALWRTRNVNTDTNGGTGGNGGQGQGQGMSANNGNNGAAGGQNAGAGGKGGAGGAWGTKGADGAKGVAGNRTDGTAGQTGALGGWAIEGAGNYTLEGTGEVVGRT